ncbi:MAG: ADP-ribosylglycohydrolase family protein [Clostridia bacterium]|nr:ADP-ribosylglycohydrolase family protein [Clostridia bacterium]
MSEQVQQTKVNAEALRDRIRGCLIGSAAGDALGYPVEFLPEKLIAGHYGEGGISSYVLSSESGKAEISDDTQMTLFTANGVLAAETQTAAGVPCRPYRMVARAYQDWLRTQQDHFRRGSQAPRVCWLMDVPELYELRAPGNACLGALERQAIVPLGDTDCIEVRQSNSKGCGGIMRAAPIALRPAPDGDMRWLQWEAAQIAAITHGHSLGYMPAAVFAHIVYRLVFREPELTLREIVFEAMDTAGEVFAGDENLETLKDLIDQAVYLSVTDRPDLQNIHQLGEGWVAEETLAIAIYCALRYQDDFSRGLTVSVNHRGDSDSTGAVCVNILGALVGYEAMEDKWKRDLELSDVILEMADDLARGCPADLAGDADWHRKYVEAKR